MHDYYTIWKVQIQSSTNGSLNIAGYISGANGRYNGRLRVCQGLSQRFACHYIVLIRGALRQGRVVYKATPTGWDKMQD